MALRVHHQMASFQTSFDLSLPRKYFKHIVTQKCRHHFSKRSEANIEVFRTNSRVAVYKETLWSHDFIEGLESNISINCKEKVNELEEKVKAIMVEYENGGSSTLELLELIDDIDRLGVSYRFQTSITRILNKIVAINENNSRLEEDEKEDNLHLISLKFRILRQHGYNVPQDFGKRINDNHGDFVRCPRTNKKALLSIYEASYLALKGEIDLHEAKLFATKNLLKLNGDENKLMNGHVDHPFDIPLYRRMLRLEARRYIDAYGKQKDANQPLLELAMLDFNMVQSAHKTNLQEVSKWWRNTGLASKLSFIRDRLMEWFFWSVGMVFEPQYHSFRIGLTKVAALINVIDDIYDVYGSLDELKILTDAVKRWDINAVNYMPESVQIGFLALYNMVNEMGYDYLLVEGRNIITIIAKVWGELLEAFLVEAKWSHSNYMPTLEDYLDNGWRSASGVVLLTHGYFLMNQDAKKDHIEYLEKFHDLYKWSSMIFRLYNDLAISPDEKDGNKSANAVSCHMHEHGVCEEVARDHIKTIVDKAWMKMIEARIACSKDMVADPLADMALNLARVANCMYQYEDAIKAPEGRAKDWVLSIIIEPVTIKENEHQINQGYCVEK